MQPQQLLHVKGIRSTFASEAKECALRQSAASSLAAAVVSYLTLGLKAAAAAVFPPAEMSNFSSRRAAGGTMAKVREGKSPGADYFRSGTGAAAQCSLCGLVFNVILVSFPSNCFIAH